MFEKEIGKSPGESTPSARVQHRNRSGVVELVGREPLMFAKVENGVTKSCLFFRRKNREKAFSALQVSLKTFPVGTRRILW